MKKLKVMRYTIKFRENDQDNLNFIPFEYGVSKMPPYLDFDEVFEHSAEMGYLTDPKEIKTLVDGSNHVEPYFTSLPAWEDCKATIEGDTGQTFRKSKTVYEVF